MNKGKDTWGLQDVWENEAQTKDKTSYRHNATKHKEHEMLRMKEQDIVLGMT